MTTAPKPLTPPKTRAQGGNTTDLKLWLHDLLSQGPLRIRDIYARAGWTAEGDTKQIENALQRLKSDQNVRCVNGVWGLPDADFGPVVPPPVAPVPRVQPVKAEPVAHVDATTQAEHHATRAYLREQLAKIAGVPKAALAGLQDDQLAHAAHAQVERYRTYEAPAKAEPAPVAPDTRGQVAGRALWALAVDVGMGPEEGTAPAKLAEFVQRAINDLRAEGDEADAALKVAVGERNVALQQLADIDRRLGLSEPYTVEERNLAIADLRATAIEATSLTQRLATAQDVIRRLEGDVHQANDDYARVRADLEARTAVPPAWWDPRTMKPLSALTQGEDGQWEIEVWPADVDRGRRFVDSSMGAVLADALHKLLPDRVFLPIIEIENSQKYLRDAQAETQRLEGLLRTAQAGRQVAETHARTPCQRYDEVVDDVWHELSSDLGMLIMGGESTGAEIALRALGALHDAQKFLLALRVHHCGMVGPEAAT
jgi:hypothetical protein